jgi:hypothetical protein
MGSIKTALQDAFQRIDAAARSVGRDSATIRLVAVSKTFRAEAIREAWAAGQRAFGENYVQEAIGKIEACADLAGIEWHLIGPLQSNKARPVAERFAWAHTLDRLRVAERLAAARPDGMPALQACIQVNISGEETKSGVAPGEALALARAVLALPRLRLRGFMGIAEATGDPDRQRAQFAVLRQLLEAARREGLALDTLSMGMSGDLEAAIAEGATIVRLGTAVFGQRGRGA